MGYSVITAILVTFKIILAVGYQNTGIAKQNQMLILQLKTLLGYILLEKFFSQNKRKFNFYKLESIKQFRCDKYERLCKNE